MSRNAGTLVCPHCRDTFTQDCLAFSPVCPKCGYTRRQGGDPKFWLIDNVIKLEDEPKREKLNDTTLNVYFDYA